MSGARALLSMGLLTLLIAGCVAPAANDLSKSSAVADLAGSTRVPPPDKDLSKAIVSDHGAPYMHAIPALHTGSYRMELVGYNPLTQPVGGDNPLVMNSAWAAITIWQHLACISHFAGTGGAGGATIVNFTDPAKPVVVASIPDMQIGSRCQFTEDGKFLLVASYGGAQPGIAALGPEGDIAANGLSVYDVSDVKNPKFLFHDDTGISNGGFEVINSNYHNIGTVLINGTNYVFQTYSGIILALAPDGKSLKQVAHVEHSDHDVWVGRHPITNDWMLVTGAGQGTAFYDINDPAHPVLLGTYEGNRTYQGWHRQWPLAQTVGGKAIMIVAGEECGNGKSLPYTVLDWTDPLNIITLGHWQIPGNPEIKEPGQLCSMNSHEFNTWNGYVATGNYHAGVWVFDAGTPERTLAPTTVGYYEPHETPALSGGTRNTPFAWSPDVWGAYFDDRGYVLAADWYSGFYVLKVTGMDLG
ncbi:MAG: hypothetical protein WDA16_02595 [Candidatus Thermoplasmatota archaeon]